jgi:ribosomal protein S27E
MIVKRDGIDEPAPGAELPRPRLRPSEFRVYCFSCGRSTSVSIPPRRPGRCLTCGGTMAIEMETA